MGIYNNDPDIQVNVVEDDLPLSVWKEVVAYCFVAQQEGYDAHGQPFTDADPLSEVLASYENSRIQIGFTAEEKAVLLNEKAEKITLEIWPRLRHMSRPVAQWDSGISVGCHQTLWMNDSGEFYWTEP